jgi:hypothetical protein
MHVFFLIWHWVQEVLGVNTGLPLHTLRWYNFFSGAGSDIGEVALVGSLIAIWRGTRCHIDGCNRHGKFQFKHYKLCRIHHPHIPQGGVSHTHIMQLHKKDQEAEYEY